MKALRGTLMETLKKALKDSARALNFSRSENITDIVSNVLNWLHFPSNILNPVRVLQICPIQQEKTMTIKTYYNFSTNLPPIRQSAKFQKRLRNDFRGDQMLMKDTIAHSVEWSMPINFQGDDN